VFDTFHIMEKQQIILFFTTSFKRIDFTMQLQFFKSKTDGMLTYQCTIFSCDIL